MKKYKILLVEDDHTLAGAILDLLELNGYKVQHVERGDEAVDAFSSLSPDVVLLDVVLPEVNGYQIAEKMQKINGSVPIIFMTGSETELTNRMKGYELGAREYLIKPFYPEELLAKIKIWQSTRIVAQKNAKRYTFHGITYELRSDFELSLNEESVQLTHRQYQIIEILFDNFESIVTKTDVIQAVWRNESQENDQMLRNSITTLRKLIAPLNFDIRTIYGVGYVITLSSSSTFMNE